MAILIVEDTAFQARILYEILKPTGVAIFTASSRKEALEILETVQINLIVADIHLPQREDGLKLIRRLRDRPETEKIPIFGCTMDAEEDTHSMLRALGIEQIFVKPYNAQTMLKTVQQVLWGRAPMLDNAVPPMVQ